MSEHVHQHIIYVSQKPGQPGKYRCLCGHEAYYFAPPREYMLHLQRCKLQRRLIETKSRFLLPVEWVIVYKEEIVLALLVAALIAVFAYLIANGAPTTDVSIGIDSKGRIMPIFKL